MKKKDVIEMIASSRGKLIKVRYNDELCGEKDLYGIKARVDSKRQMLILQSSYYKNGMNPLVASCFIPHISGIEVISIGYAAWLLTEAKKFASKTNDIL